MTIINPYYFSEYMILTARDLHIFHLLNEFGVLESNTLSKIVSSTSNHKTVSARLLTLKKQWYIKEIGAKERMRRKNIIYSLNTTKETIKKIYLESWIQYYPRYYNSSYTMLNHQIYLWKLVGYLIIELKKRNIEVDIGKIKWSKTIQKLITTEQDNTRTFYEYLEYTVIPDAIIQIWDTLYCFELENTNSYWQAEEKIRKYNQLLMRKDNNKFFSVFQGKKLVLIVGCWDYKNEKYKEILKEGYTWKSITVNIEKL